MHSKNFQYQLAGSGRSRSPTWHRRPLEIRATTTITTTCRVLLRMKKHGCSRKRPSGLFQSSRFSKALDYFPKLWIAGQCDLDQAAVFSVLLRTPGVAQTLAQLNDSVIRPGLVRRWTFCPDTDLSCSMMPTVGRNVFGAASVIPIVRFEVAGLVCQCRILTFLLGW